MRYRLGIVVLFVSGALLLTLLYGEQLREQVLRPFLYGLWLLWLRMQGLPFDPIWAAFVALAALAVYLGVIDLFLQTDTDPRRMRLTKFGSAGPILSLMRKIKMGVHGDLARWNLYRDLTYLAVDWIALHDNITRSEARRRFLSGQALDHLREMLLLDFPDPDRKPTRRRSRRAYLDELNEALTELEDFALYERGHCCR